MFTKDTFFKSKDKVREVTPEEAYKEDIYDTHIIEHFIVPEFKKYLEKDEELTDSANTKAPDEKLTNSMDNEYPECRERSCVIL